MIFFAKLVRHWKSKEWAKFELKCLLLIFIYSNSKLKVTCKRGLWMWEIGLIPKRSRLKFLSFCFLSEKNPFSWFAILSTLESTTFAETKMIHFNIRNAKSRVAKPQLYYLRTTHSSILKGFLPLNAKPLHLSLTIPYLMFTKSCFFFLSFFLSFFLPFSPLEITWWCRRVFRRGISI